MVLVLNLDSRKYDDHRLGRTATAAAIAITPHKIVTIAQDTLEDPTITGNVLAS